MFFSPYSYYTLLSFSALQPLCGIPVTSAIEVTFNPTFVKDLIAASLPGPGPFTFTSTVS